MAAEDVGGQRLQRMQVFYSQMPRHDLTEALRAMSVNVAMLVIQSRDTVPLSKGIKISSKIVLLDEMILLGLDFINLGNGCFRSTAPQVETVSKGRRTRH